MEPVHTLFGYTGSGSAAAEIGLSLCGIPFRSVQAASWAPDSAHAELAAANPLGQIPTLRLPDGSILTESAAILIYLGLEYPGARLLPSGTAQRAQAIRGLVYIAANCYSAISVIDFPERWCADPDETTNERIRRGARARLHRHWEIFADQFARQPLLGGAELGALDILAAVVSQWSGTRAHLRSARPEFHATIERIDGHPAVAPVFARHWPR
jgi:GST-like protein